MPKIDIAAITERRGTSYPSRFHAVVAGRARRALGDAGGLTQFGVNLTRLEPGAATALRHWHENEDEFVFVLEGQAVLIDDDGETQMGPGDAAAFKAGDPNGHHLVNRGDRDVLLLEIGTRSAEERAFYPDDDMQVETRGGEDRFTRPNGEPFADD